MARLPTRDRLAQTSPRLTTGRVAFPQASVASALDRAGSSLERAGAQLDVKAKRDSRRAEIEANKEKQKLDSVELARARSIWSSGLIEKTSAYTLDQKPDFNSWGVDFDKGIPKLRKTAADTISNPELRKKFELEIADDEARASAKISSSARREGTQSLRINSEISLQKLVESAATSDDDEAKEGLASIGATLDDLVKSGVYSPAEAAKADMMLRRKFAQLKAEQSLAIDPRAAEAALSGDAVGFNVSLARTESGGRYSAVNDEGFTGKYQWGEARLADFNKANDTNYTLKQFKASPKIQEKAQAWSVADFDNFIKKNGLDKAIGTQIGGVTITLNGLRAAAHLGGKNGMKKFVESKGKYNPEDSNGTSLLDYARTHGTDAPEYYKWLTESDRRKYAKAAGRNANAIARDAAKQAEAERKAALDKLRFSIDDGTADESDIQEAKASGLFKNFKEFKSVEKQHEKAVKERREVDSFEDFMRGDVTIDYANKSDKSMVDTFFEKTVGRASLGEASEKAAASLLDIVKRANATPKQARGMLTSMLNGVDDKKAIYALQTLNSIRKVNPDAFARDFNTATEKAVDRFAVQAEFTTPEKLLERIRQSNDPVSSDIIKERGKVASKEIADLQVDDVTDLFDGLFTWEPSPSNAERGEVLTREYKELYRAEYERTGNADEAKQITLGQLRRVWGVSTLTGSNILMKHAPEKFFPTVGGSHEWMSAQLKEDLATITGERVLPSFNLIAVPGFNKQNPRYNILTQEDGVVDLLRDKSNKPLQYTFDPEPFVKKERQSYKKKREVIKENREFWLNDGGVAKATRSLWLGNENADVLAKGN